MYPCRIVVFVDIISQFINVDNLNIFSNLALLKGLAHSTSQAEHKSLQLTSTYTPIKVYINGLEGSLIDVRNSQCIDKIRVLTSELLMGFKPNIEYSHI